MTSALTYLEPLSLPCSVLEPEEQLGTLQLLIYLLPPCNCDTLHRLLQFLSIVARHAEDNVSKDGQEVCTPLPRMLASSFFLFGKGELKKNKAASLVDQQ